MWVLALHFVRFPGSRKLEKGHERTKAKGEGQEVIQHDSRKGAMSEEIQGRWGLQGLEGKPNQAWMKLSFSKQRRK